MSFFKYGIILTLLYISAQHQVFAFFESCDHIYYLGANRSMYLNSPDYPSRYPSGTSCRYRIIAPEDYQINIECNVNVDKFESSCTTETFFIATDGSSDMDGSEYFCGNGYIQRKSLFQSLTLAYTSASNSNAGQFSCLLRASPQPCDCGWSTTSRIVNGVEASINEYPLIAGIIYTPTTQIFCGGTIIGHRYVLTAVHCIKAHPNAKELAVVVGEHDVSKGSESPYTMVHKVLDYILHEQYETEGHTNDIALIITETSIQWSRGVGPACLPFSFAQANLQNVGVDVAGWGTSSFAGPASEVLMKAHLYITSNEQCKNFFPYIADQQMCTYSASQDACQFDSGGPLIYRGQRLFAVGIVSFGIACGTQKPSVNTRLSMYLDWILQNTNEKFCVI